jgi:hypothetical protein
MLLLMPQKVSMLFCRSDYPLLKKSLKSMMSKASKKRRIERRLIPCM